MVKLEDDTERQMRLQRERLQFETRNMKNMLAYMRECGDYLRNWTPFNTEVQRESCLFKHFQIGNFFGNVLAYMNEGGWFDCNNPFGFDYIDEYQNLFYEIEMFENFLVEKEILYHHIPIPTLDVNDKKLKLIWDYKLERELEFVIKQLKGRATKEELETAKMCDHEPWASEKYLFCGDCGKVIPKERRM